MPGARGLAVEYCLRWQGNGGGLTIRDTADYQSALRGWKASDNPSYPTSSNESTDCPKMGRDGDNG